jgi:hypothetical protein
MKRVKDFDKHQEEVIKEIRDRLEIYKKRNKVKK